MASRTLLASLARSASASLAARSTAQQQQQVRLVSHSRVCLAQVPDGLRKWAFNMSGFNQYGLYHDDALQETEDLKEAVRRLPPQLQVSENKEKVDTYTESSVVQHGRLCSFGVT